MPIRWMIVEPADRRPTTNRISGHGPRGSHPCRHYPRAVAQPWPPGRAAHPDTAHATRDGPKLSRHAAAAAYRPRPRSPRDTRPDPPHGRGMRPIGPIVSPGWCGSCTGRRCTLRQHQAVVRPRAARDAAAVSIGSSANSSRGCSYSTPGSSIRSSASSRASSSRSASRRAISLWSRALRPFRNSERDELILRAAPLSRDDPATSTLPARWPAPGLSWLTSAHDRVVPTE